MLVLLYENLHSNDVSVSLHHVMWRRAQFFPPIYAISMLYRLLSTAVIAQCIAGSPLGSVTVLLPTPDRFPIGCLLLSSQTEVNNRQENGLALAKELLC